jgi:Secretion system C-terminal sorting domain
VIKARQFTALAFSLMALFCHAQNISLNPNQQLSGIIQGTVVDGNSGQAIEQVLIKAGLNITHTNADGFYYFYAGAGQFDISYQKEGYQTHIEEGVVANPGNPKTIDVNLWENLSPPDSVSAIVNSNDTECLVEWSETDQSFHTGRSPIDFKVIRYSNFHPDSLPQTGTSTLLEQHNGTTSYLDIDFASLPEGWYAYGIASWYQQGGPGYVLSDYQVSNKVGHLNHSSIQIQVNSLAKKVPLENAHISFHGLEFPYAHLTGLTDENGQFTFDKLWKGLYDFSIGKETFKTHVDNNLRIQNDTLIVTVLGTLTYPPRNFHVDSTSSTGTWEAPEICVLFEDFEDSVFPPQGWQTRTEGVYTWKQGSGILHNEWSLKPWDSYYSYIVGEHGNGSWNIGCCDYLITPRLDLRDNSEFHLQFDTYYYSEFFTGTVEISDNFGEDWETITLMLPEDKWNKMDIDLSDYSGVNGQYPNHLWISFHGNDNGNHIDGWAIDNVKISAENDSLWAPSGLYHVMLDSVFMSETEDTSYHYLNLEYGKEYTAAVAALYNNASPDTSFYTFTSAWLYPAENIRKDTSNNVIWDMPQAPWLLGDSIPENLLGFNLYRDLVFVEFFEYLGQDSLVSNDPIFQAPAKYYYQVAAVYDLSPYGYSGQQGESIKNGPVEIWVSYGEPLPFTETWESGNFTHNGWIKDSDNWIIQNDSGLPAPSAQFKGLPKLNDFACPIITPYFSAAQIEDGETHLEFDLKGVREQLYYGTETFHIDLWENKKWHNIETINLFNDTTWNHYHFIISKLCKGKDFQVSFAAQGDYSVYLRYWQIDNIQVYHLCDEPNNLRSTVIDLNPENAVIALNWFPPIAGAGKWLSVNDGFFEDAICSTYGGGGLAQTLNAGTSGYCIEGIRYFNADIGNVHGEMEVYILESWDGEILGGPYIVDDAPGNTWVYVPIDITLNYATYFIVYTKNVQPDGPYVGIDTNNYNARLRFGNIGAFVELGQQGIYATGSHEALISYQSMNGKAHRKIISAAKPGLSKTSIELNKKPIDYSATLNKNQRGLIGYNIWRNDVLIEEAWPHTFYFDTLHAANEYCYYISAVMHQCESDTVGVVCESFFLGDKQYHSESQIKVYPNPAKELITIESTSALLQITVLDIRGRVKNKINTQDEKSLKINTSKFENGIYFIKIRTKNGEQTEKIAVMK